MGLKDIYLKIEDKWFDFLDLLDDKGIPVYTLIDPLEKNGIPSMPVYLTLLVAIIAGAFFFASGSGSSFSLGGGIPVNAYVTNVLNESVPSTLSILDMQGRVVKTLTSDNGTFNLKLKNGDYYFSVNSSNCTPINNQLVEVNGEPLNENFGLECQGLSLRSAVHFCFSPEQTGSIEVTGYEGGLPVSDDQCSASDCSVNLVNDGRTYKFSKGNLESQSFTFNDLLGYMNSPGNCIQLEKKVEEPQSMEKVVLKIEDQQGKSIKFADVQLVSPEDDESVLQEQTTDDNGTAVFKQVGLGTKFQVKILGTENTTTYLHDVIYTVPHGGLIETIRINRSASSKVQVQVQKEIGMDYAKGALITLIDKDTGKISNTKQANSTGEAVFGVEKNKEYTLGVWARGYGYVEQNLIGGEDASIIMNNTQERGNIQASVFLEDEPLAGVKLTLYNDEKREVGIYAANTNTQGQTMFYDVPAGDYCIIAHRNIGSPSDCVDVTVNANDTTNAEIDLQKQKFTYLFHVQKKESSGLMPVKNAEVNIYDDENTSGDKITTGTTDRYGNVKLELPEQLIPLVSVNYNEGGVKYITEETLGKVRENSSVNITVRKLALEAHFEGIKDKGKLMNLSKESLAADSNSYYVVISVGLPNYKGKKWDKVSFTISSESGGVEFYQGSNANRNGFQPAQDDELLSSRTFELTKYKLGNESKDGKTIIVKIPFKVRATSLGDDLSKQMTLDLQTTWTSGSTDFNYPQQGSEQLNFNVTRQKCDMMGNFLVCSSITKDDGKSLNPFASSSLNINLGNSTTLNYVVTNEQEKDFNGDITLADTEQGLKINSLTASIAGEELKQFTDIVYDKDTQVTTIHVKNLKPFQSIKIIVQATAIKPPTSIINLGVGDNSKDLYSLSIQGQEKPELVLVDPTNGLFDLTNSMTFYLKSNLTGNKIPVTWYVSSTKIKNLEGGEITINPYDGLSYVDSSDNTITIYFSKDYHLKGGSYVEITTGGDYLNPLDKKILVSNCIESPGTPISFFADMKKPCEVDFTTADSLSAGLSDASTGYCTEGNNYQLQFKNNCGADIKLNQPIFDEQRASKNAPKGGQLSSDDSSFTYDSQEYSGGTTTYRGKEFSVPINTTITFTNGELSVTYPINFTLIEIKNDPQQPTVDGTPFTPLKTASLTNPTCDENTYCTIQQFGESLKEKINNMPEGSTAIQIRTNLLIDNSNPAVGSVNINELKSILSNIFGTGIVSIATSGDIPSPVAGHLYLLTNGFPSMGLQGGAVTLTVSKRLTKDNDDYYMITQMSSKGVPASIGNSVVYAQLEMPYYNPTPNNEKFKIQAVDDSSTPMPGLNPYIKKLFAAMYSTKDSNIYISLKKPKEASASNLIHFAICNDDKDINCNDVCGKFNVFTNMDQYDGIVFKSIGNQDAKQNGVYFIARSPKSLIKLINATANAINKTNHGQETQDLYLNTRNVCLDANGLLTEVNEGEECPNSISTVFLSFPSNKVKVFCADESLGCSDLKDNMDNKVAKTLVDYYSKQRGVSPAEIELVNEKKIEDSRGDFTSDVVIINNDTLSTDDYKSIKNDLITEINQQGRTVFGIPDYYLTNYDGTTFVIIPNEDNITTIFQDKGYLNITGLDLTKQIVRTMKGEDTGLDGKTMLVNLVKDNCSVTGALQDFGIKTYNTTGEVSTGDKDDMSTINEYVSASATEIMNGGEELKDNKYALPNTGKFLIKINKENNKLYSKYEGDTSYINKMGQLTEDSTSQQLKYIGSVINEFREKASNCALRKSVTTPFHEEYLDDAYIFFHWGLGSCLNKKGGYAGFGSFGTHYCSSSLNSGSKYENAIACDGTTNFEDRCSNLGAKNVSYSPNCGVLDISATMGTDFKEIYYCDSSHADCVKEAHTTGTATYAGICCPIGFHNYNKTEKWCEKAETPATNQNQRDYVDAVQPCYQDSDDVSKCGGGGKCGNNYNTISGFTTYKDAYCKTNYICKIPWDGKNSARCCPSDHPNYDASKDECY